MLLECRSTVEPCAIKRPDGADQRFDQWDRDEHVDVTVTFSLRPYRSQSITTSVAAGQASTVNVGL